MIYFADLHVHSKYSRATSKDCDLIHLAQWAALKGLRVVATGDFTHPAWREEIKTMLVDAEDGLFRLRDTHVPHSAGILPGGFGPGDIRFMLNVEISSIYKKNGATRKVHNLIYMPDMDSMERCSSRLERIGNIRSDGRPILGLDSRDLLEISLEASPDSFFIPAHIWTPWFSILGSRSGFDSVEECFEDLTPHVFALETGLSSDPEMNHRVSALDRYTLTSNSDTHSPPKLGRQANVFRGEPGYVAIREGLRSGGSWARGLSIEEIVRGTCAKPGGSTGDAEDSEAGDCSSTFVGTLDFFPEEGKYHLDGHRKCGVRLEPEETDRMHGMCPVCGHPVTVGVMNRVVELADRPRGVIPDRAAPFWRLIPLSEVVGNALGVGPQSKKVEALSTELLRRLGPEVPLLWSRPLDEIASQAPAVITEAIRRARAGEVHLAPGFDGQYGVVKLFGEGERDHFAGQESFMPMVKPTVRARTAGRRGRQKKQAATSAEGETTPEPKAGLNAEQLAAVKELERPVLVQAGPGTGKTGTLSHRIVTLIEDKIAAPEHITAVTFTRKAAQEMRERVGSLLPEERIRGCWVGTFHQLGSRILDLFRQKGKFEGRTNVLDQDQALGIFREAVRTDGLKVAAGAVPSLFSQASLLKQNLQASGDGIEDPVLRSAYACYERGLALADALDLDDLLTEPVRLLRDNPQDARDIAENLAVHLLVDEFQDVNRAQYEMVRLLAAADGRGLFVIGDPDQAIYGFRGSDRRFFASLPEDYPACRTIRLVKNYRSQAFILKAARRALALDDSTGDLVPERAGGTLVRKVRLPNAATEAEFIMRTIDALLGGASFFSLDSRQIPVQSNQRLGFGDFAVLYRLNAVGDALEKAFLSANIPFQRARKVAPEEEAEAHDPRAEAVTLMTIHASKGLEFPVVFVAGCEDGVIPYIPPGETSLSPEREDEERRLLYVAMTRARDELFLTKADRRVLHGRTFEGQSCRFVKKLDRSLCEVLAPLADSGSASSRGPSQCELFG